jgi:hypothetical protein
MPGSEKIFSIKVERDLKRKRKEQDQMKRPNKGGMKPCQRQKIF